MEGECVTRGHGTTLKQAFVFFACVAKGTYDGVIVTLEAYIWFVNARAVAVLVAAALR